MFKVNDKNTRTKSLASCDTSIITQDAKTFPKSHDRSQVYICNL